MKFLLIFEKDVVKKVHISNFFYILNKFRKIDVFRYSLTHFKGKFTQKEKNTNNHI